MIESVKMPVWAFFYMEFYLILDKLFIQVCCFVLFDLDLDLSFDDLSSSE